MKTLYELKQNLVTIGQQLQKTESELSQKAVDPSATMEDIQALQKSKDDLKARFDVIKEQHDKMEAEQKAQIEQQKRNQGISGVVDPKEKIVKAKAELIRSAISNIPVSQDVRMALGDGNGSGGEKILPKTMTNELLHEPFVKNPLRNLSVFTNITNLEVPKIEFSLDDDDFIKDGETAKELEVDGDAIQFERHKFKVSADISETVIHGTDTNLVSTVDAALESGLAAKEKKVAYAVNPKTGEEHMSFYKVGIKEITASSLFDAIIEALGDLEDDYADNASVTMRRRDYYAMIKELANNSATLFAMQPKEVLGVDVEFCDAAVHPVIGDYRFSHFNYDPTILYDRDKNVKTGMEQFVLTAWIDHRIKLKSAFRIAKVKKEETP